MTLAQSIQLIQQIQVSADSPIETKQAKFFNYYGTWVINKYFQNYVSKIQNANPIFHQAMTSYLMN